MKYFVVLISVLAIGCGAMVDKSKAEDTLQSAGYTDVHCGADSHWLAPGFHGCGSDDDVAFECTATNPAGKRVELTVCAAYLFKGATIRHR